MRRTQRILLTGLAAAGLLVGGAAAAGADAPDAGGPRAGGASAVTPAGSLPGSPPCKATLGNLLRTYKHGDWATLEIYWDGEHKTNCAYLRHGSKVGPGEHYTVAEIFTCDSNREGARCEQISWRPPYYDHDEDDYTSFAGKVSVKGVGRGGAPKCIYAWGIVSAGGSPRFIDVNGVTNSANANPRGKHCG